MSEQESACVCVFVCVCVCLCVCVCVFVCMLINACEVKTIMRSFRKPLLLLASRYLSCVQKDQRYILRKRAMCVKRDVVEDEPVDTKQLRNVKDEFQSKCTEEIQNAIEDNYCKLQNHEN